MTKKLALIREGGRYPSQDEARDDHASRTVIPNRPAEHQQEVVSLGKRCGQRSGGAGQLDVGQGVTLKTCSNKSWAADWQTQQDVGDAKCRCIYDLFACNVG